ncbi:MAG: PAS domain S-box protein [Candidatus Latescibacteria bacterium]|nr:PAS domain S-box protein [Candidatus Latescibacterota bacterium]
MKDTKQTEHQLINKIEKLQKQLTELKHEKECLQTDIDRLSLYSSMIEQSMDSIIYMDKEFKITYINKAAKELYGWNFDEIKGKTPDLFNAETFADKTQHEIYSTVSSGKTYSGEALNRRKDGSSFYCRFQISPIFDKSGYICGYMGSQTDITQSKNAFEALYESEDYLRIALESAGEGMWEYNIDEGIVEFDSAALNMLGFSEIDAPRDANFWWKLIHPDDLNNVKEIFRKHIEKEIDRYSVEFRIKAKTNEWKWIASHGKIIESEEQDKVLLMVGTHRDITEQKKAESAMRESEDRFKILFEFAPDAYYLSDLKGTFIDGNKTAEMLSGYRREELIGRNFIKLLPAMYIPKASATLLQNAFGKATGPDEFVINRKDGSKVTVEIRTYPVKIKDKVLVLGIARDISERKESENLIRIQRDMGLALSTTRDMETALKTSLEHTLKIDGIDSGGIYFLDQQTGSLHLECYTGISENCVAVISHFNSDSPNTCLVMKGKPVFTDYGDLENTDTPILKNIKSLAIIPLKHKKQVIGSLNLASHSEQKITPSAKSTLESLASQITGVIVRIKAEEALRESEERLSGFINSATDAFYLLDSDLNFIEINEQGLKMIGKKRKDVIGKNISEIIPDVKESGQYEKHLEVLRTGNLFMIEDFVPHPVYGDCYFILKSFKVGDGLGVIASDISEIKKAEEALRASEEKYRLLLESTPDIIMRFDKNLRHIYVSPSIKNINGIEPEEFLGKRHRDMDFPSELVDYWESMIKDVFRSGKSELGQFEIDLTSSKAVFDWRLFPEHDSNGNIISVYTTARDITEQKRAENALRESEERLRAIFVSSPDAIITTDVNGIINSCNYALIKLYQCESEQELLNQSVFTIIAPREREKARENFLKIPQFGELRNKEFIFLTKHNEEFPVEVSASVIKDRHGKPVSLIAVVKDKRERKAAEEALKAERDRATMYFTVARVMLVVIKTDQTVNMINEKGCEILGYNADEIIGKNWFDNFIPGDQNENIKDVFKKLATGKMDLVEYHENQVVTKNGELRTIAWHNAIIKDETGTITGTLSSGEDISERIKAEEERIKLQRQLLQAQKMESIGRLAGGIAHDFNNLLTVISGSCELILMSTSHDDELYKDINEIKKSADRASNLTRQLLAFSRRQIIEPQIINLNDLILNMDNMLRRLIGEDLELLTLTAEDLWLVNVDPGQIEQVLTNLVVNARDAMPDGGKLTIETLNVTLDEEYTNNHNDTHVGDFVMLAVSDTGVGMDEKTVSHIFEPFFTTKETGKGTGLGLSTCYGIVKQNKGNIWVYSEPGLGTAIKVYLPKSEFLPDRESKKIERIKIPAGTETVLVVEDEPTVLKMTTRILRNAGYTVYEATNGEEALRGLHDKTFDNVDLLITDVIMPRMGGKELHSRMQKQFGGIKILFMSGYTDNSIVHHGILESGLSYIQKPFSPDMLIKKVRQALDE